MQRGEPCACHSVSAGLGRPWERPQTFPAFRAAAQLDHFSLREKSGLKQCSQKAPETQGKFKQRPDCSQGRPSPTLTAIRREALSGLKANEGRSPRIQRSMPVGVPENSGHAQRIPRIREFSARTVRVQIFAQQKLSSSAAAECGECAVAFRAPRPASTGPRSAIYQTLSRKQETACRSPAPCPSPQQSPTQSFRSPATPARHTSSR